MEIVQILIVVLGGNAAIVTALAFLARSLVTHRLAKDIREFESELKAKSDAAIESLKSSLQIAAKEHEIRFSTLHEKQAEVIAEMHRHVVEAGWAVGDLVSPFEQSGEPSKAEKYGTAMNRVAECFRFFDVNQIYLPPHLCVELEKLISEMRRLSIGFGVYLHTPNQTIRSEGKKLNAWMKSIEDFEREIPTAKKALREEFRAMLGSGERDT